MAQRSATGMVLGTVVEVACIVLVVSLLPRVDLRPRAAEGPATAQRSGDVSEQPRGGSPLGADQWQPTSYYEPIGPLPDRQSSRGDTIDPRLREPPPLIRADPDAPPPATWHRAGLPAGNASGRDDIAPRTADAVSSAWPLSPARVDSTSLPHAPHPGTTGSFPTRGEEARSPAPRGSFPVEERGSWSFPPSRTSAPGGSAATWLPRVDGLLPPAPSAGRDRAAALSAPPQPQRWRSY